MVMDELDAAAALMPNKKNAADDGETEVATPATAAAAKKNALLMQSKQWWDRATSLAPTGLEPSIVSCRLRGGTQFMSKDNCLSQGGDPQRASG
jgi:hypothetical protein